MLVIGRRVGESFYIEDIEVILLEVGANRAKIGIAGSRDAKVRRREHISDDASPVSEHYNKELKRVNRA